MSVKTITVSALFPQLAAKDAEQGATGVKGKRIREARLYLTISNGGE